MSKNGKTFSVLTVSKRRGWFGMALESMRNQTMMDKFYCDEYHNYPSAFDKWYVIHEDNALLDELKYLTLYDIFTFPKLIPAPKKTRVSNLNASLNEGLRRIYSDYVIFYQDFIELEKDCFERLLLLADENTFVTTCTPNYDGSNDGRYTGTNNVHECPANHWEANVAIAPMKIIRELGGFDEEYDNGWSWDNVNLAERAEMLGCKFIIDESNRPKLYPHEMSSHETLPSNADRHYDTMKAIRRGEKPLRLNYLGAEHGAATV